MRRVERMCAAATATLVVWSPRIAEACAVCAGSREDENRLAFILTTVFLTFLPLTLVGSLVFWLWRRVQAQERSAGRRDAGGDGELGAVAGRIIPLER